MNDLDSIAPAVDRLKTAGVPYAILHCTSMYPTPYDKVRLGALADLAHRFEGAVLGLSDHSLGNYTCFAAVALGASILEKHFTADKSWPGPDVPISIDPTELRDLITGTKAIHAALGGQKSVLAEEQPTIAFAYACVVAVKDIQPGEPLTKENIWVKRPGTGEIKAADYDTVLGRIARRPLRNNAQLELGGHSLGLTCRKTILFITGTRADFGKLKPLIRKVADDDDFEYRIFVTGMHMLSRYGSTVSEIQKSGFTNLFMFINYADALTTGMDLALANTIQGLGHYIREFPADLIVVHGDRTEALAGAVVGALNGILVAHVEGGEVSGTVDELLRHSISKLCHLHFVANEESQDRLIQMGEVPGTVYVIGSPDIDVMLSNGLPTAAEVRSKYQIGFDEYLVFHLPPGDHGSEFPEDANRGGDEGVGGVRARTWSSCTRTTIRARGDSGRAAVGWRAQPRFRVLPSMRFEFFLTLLKTRESHRRQLERRNPRSAGLRRAHGQHRHATAESFRLSLDRHRSRRHGPHRRCVEAIADGRARLDALWQGK